MRYLFIIVGGGLLVASILNPNDAPPIISEYALWLDKVDINIKIVVCVVVFILAALFLPKSDKRFKTGYKDNIEPGVFSDFLIPLIMFITFLLGVGWFVQRFISNIPG